jgi:hypothetical protein
MKRGVPPTERKARTGELTPPGMTAWARVKSVSFRLVFWLMMNLEKGAWRNRLEKPGPAGA